LAEASAVLGGHSATEIGTETAYDRRRVIRGRAGTLSTMPATDPGRWEADVVLTDGGTVHLRPIRPDDADALLGLHARLSDESVYLRFFSPVPRPSPELLDRLVNVDYGDRMALVAELGGDVIGVGRYDRLPSGDEAEVAFTVQDEHQGRGLGTILLEHLAAVAREQGIRRFRASTLPQNRRMLDVFRDAGFEVERTFAEGVVDVGFVIDPSASALAAQRAREHRSEARSVARLLAPRSVAIVGAGRRQGTIGHEILRNLLAGGFTGVVYPVNATAHAVAGVRAYPSVLDVPDEVDLAVVAVPAEVVLGVVDECARKGVGGLVVITAGFAETAGGSDRQRELVTASRRCGMRLVGPNCMGIVNTNSEVRLNATFAPTVAVPGRVAFASQSGAFGIELLARTVDLGLGVSSFVSVGNKADVSGNDLLQYWEDDPDTDVILLYLESFGNPRKFARLARRIARSKPIVAVKSGRTSTGVRAASSHTAALGSTDAAVNALFRQAGVIRVDTLEQLFDTAQVLAHQPIPAGRRLAIVSNGGGPGILAADTCEAAGLDVPELAPETQARLREFVSPDATVRNPLDLVASAGAETFERALDIVLGGDEVDAALAIFTPPLVTKADDVARAIVRAAGRATRPVVACFLGQHGVPEELRGDGPDARTVPSFAFPESAVLALGRAADHGDWLRRPEGVVPALTGVDRDRAQRIVDTFLAEHPDGGWLPPDDAVALCDAFGIAVLPLHRATTAAEAGAAAGTLGLPVALKAGSGDIVHKTDVGAVHLGLASTAAVEAAFDDMHKALGEQMGGAVVQPMAEPGIETIVGVVHDASFGPLVLFGMGGTAAELVRDTAMRIVPITDADAHDVVRALRTSPLLFGYRGTPLADVAALEQLLIRVGLLADALPQVAELDCNPVIVSPAGAVAVDVKLRLQPAPPLRPEVRALRRP
jgi:acetyl coenzyme A synthetase (ADP forming)-like protein